METSIPRQIALVIRWIRASVAFFFVSSRVEKRRTLSPGFAGLDGAGAAAAGARGGVRSIVRLMMAVSALGL